MKIRKIGARIFMAALQPVLMLSGCAAENDSELPVSGVILPDAEWQIDVTFPDWKGVISANTAANSRIGFYAYRDQGVIYLTAEENCDGFSLFVNDRKAAVNVPETGETLQVDISSLTRNGMNSIQISDLAKGKIRLCIPYPEVINGTPEDAGISKDSLDLIDRIISADIRHGFSSAQLAVIKDGKLVYSNAWGNTKTYDETGKPVDSSLVTADTLYDLASNTKPYSVNYAIQYLVTKGEVTLDTKVEEIIGKEFSEDTIEIAYEGHEAADLKTLKKWKKELTLKHLLMHQGGFPPGPHYYNDRYDHASQYFDSDKGNVIYAGTSADEAAREETLKAICRTPQMYEPGTGTEYSDVDYMLLCYCLEKITGKRLDEYLEEVFWQPLGLDHICYNPLEHGFVKEDCAATELMGNTRQGRLHYTGIREYTLQGEVHDPNAWYCMDGVSGHAGMFANAIDLAKLAFIMLTGGYGNKKYFTPDVIRLFSAPSSAEAPDYGLGWWVEGNHNWDSYYGSVSDPMVFGHQGFTGTMTLIDPQENMVIVFLTNKIHNTMRPDDETLGKYDGNYYTSASLGFVSQILEIGRSGKADKEVYISLVNDMIRDNERRMEAENIHDPDHPRMRAYQALMEVLNELNS